MASDWKFSTLEEAGVILIDCVHKTPPAADEGYPYIAIPQIKNGRIDFSLNPRLISHSDYKKWTIKADPKADDIVLSRRCNPGETAYVPQGVEFALGQNLVLLRSVGDEIYSPFLRWLVRGPEWWAQVAKYLNVGAVFDSLRCGEIPRFELLIPPLPEQKAIAHILGSLDDKIELNRQMNETLEAMAQTLFKSWFVDFDPVIDNALAAGNAIPDEFAARADQRKTIEKKDNSDIQHLFPDEFEFTEEMGWIPKGWAVSNVGTEFNTVGGGTPSTKNSDFWKNGNISWTTPKDLSGNQSKILLHTDRKITELGLNKISSGLLPIDTVLMSSRAPVGYLALAKVPVAINQGYIALKCEKVLTPEFAIQWADSAMDEIKQRAGGTTFAEISKTNFRGIPVLVPSQKIIDTYSRDVKNLYNQITSRIENINTLAKLRDILLPKLMSGELRIPDAVDLIEKV